MVDFDKLSVNYKNILDKDIRIFGEKSEYFAKNKAELVRDRLGYKFQGHILDYGCGIGLVAKNLRGYFDYTRVKISAYDKSGETVNKASENSSNIFFTNDINIIENNRFDAIIVANVLHHIAVSDRRLFLGGIKRILAENGRLFVFEHNPYNPLTRMVVGSSIIDKGASLLYMNEIIGLLTEIGMDTCEKSYITFFPKFLKFLRAFEPMMRGVPIGAQYMCVGRKRV
ncbi:MAG: class I SAM-dependent methyltransferase [Candidatus Omnitrophica bacterium]|nr:class I SAM-dependent methyltransferase [Candidatus Omnitrophota bacterium]